MYTNYATDWCQRFGSYNTDCSYNIPVSSASYCYPLTCCPCPVCHKNIKRPPKLDTKNLTFTYDMPAPKQQKTTNETSKRNSSKLKKKPAKTKKTVMSINLKRPSDSAAEDAFNGHRQSSKSNIIANSVSNGSLRPSLSESGVRTYTTHLEINRFKDAGRANIKSEPRTSIKSEPRTSIKSELRESTKSDDCERLSESSDSICQYKCSCEKIGLCTGRPKVDFRVVTSKGKPFKQIHQENGKTETYCVKHNSSRRNTDGGHSQQNNYNRDKKVSHLSPKVSPGLSPKVSYTSYSQAYNYPEQSATNAAKPYECNCCNCRKNSTSAQSYNKSAFAPSKSCPQLDVINEEDSENEDDPNENTTTSPKMQKRLEDSCADFLTIICDNIMESVQKSVDSKLKEFDSQTAEKFQTLGRKLESNETAVMRLCTEVLKKMTEQNKANFEEFCSLVQGILAESRAQMKKYDTQNMKERESQYEGAKNEVKFYPRTLRPSRSEANTPNNLKTEKDEVPPRTSRTLKGAPITSNNLKAEKDDSPPRTSRTLKNASIPSNKLKEDKDKDLPKASLISKSDSITSTNLMAHEDKDPSRTSRTLKNASIPSNKLMEDKDMDPPKTSIISRSDSMTSNKLKSRDDKSPSRISTKSDDDIPETQTSPNALMSLCYFCCHSCTKVDQTDSLHDNQSTKPDERNAGGGLDDADNDDINKEVMPVNEEIKVWGLPMKNSPKTSPRQLKSLGDVMCCHETEAANQKYSSPRSFTTFSLTPSRKTIFNCQVCGGRNLRAYENDNENDNDNDNENENENENGNNSDTKLHKQIISDNYDTSGYASEPEDNNDEAITNNGRKKLLRKASKQHSNNHTSNQQIVNSDSRQLIDASEKNSNQMLKKQVRISSTNCSSSPTRLSRL